MKHWKQLGIISRGGYVELLSVSYAGEWFFQ